MLAVAATASIAAGLALATPIIGLISPILAAGNHQTDIHVHGTGTGTTGVPLEIVLKVEGPATISTQDGAYGVGGHNGWHSHQGMVFVTMISGSIQWFNENCEETDYTAGDAWAEGSKLHYFRVVGTGGVHLMATFVTAQGAALRTDQPAPACAAALGLI